MHTGNMKIQFGQLTSLSLAAIVLILVVKIILSFKVLIVFVLIITLCKHLCRRNEISRSNNRNGRYM